MLNEHKEKEYGRNAPEKASSRRYLEKEVLVYRMHMRSHMVELRSLRIVPNSKADGGWFDGRDAPHNRRSIRQRPIRR